MWYKLTEDKRVVPTDDGNPPSMLEGDKRVDSTEIKDYWISTVFLGLDHSFSSGEPLTFETMVFKKGDWSELYCKRYPTYEKAKEGHIEAIKWVLHNIYNKKVEIYLDADDKLNYYKEV